MMRRRSEKYQTCTKKLLPWCRKELEGSDTTCRSRSGSRHEFCRSNRHQKTLTCAESSEASQFEFLEFLHGTPRPINFNPGVSTPLTPLLKPDNGIRPIVVGMIWRRLVSKAAMRGVGKEMAKYLGDFQFGVGVPSGPEAVLHSANRFLNEFHSDGSLAMLTVDFTNAFNLVSRTALLHEVRTRCPSISLWVDFLYGQPARLYVEEECFKYDDKYSLDH
ncbi:hypothetical protein E3N88_34835 [Mikania micrantha]|uniref:Reverse transcriptase domain-containing protein n=1 Tax=Mikania micrantha TaxID=192012 RepID=A0A5N6LZA5_9ASTR|nr:hypothetical protein E3N88_34835 [Mikania micrantha]